MIVPAQPDRQARRRPRSCWRSPCTSCGSILIDGYSSEFTIRSMLVLASLLGVASIGQTLVVLIGGIDLSTPFVIGFANVVAAQLYGDGMNFALVCAIVGVLALAIGAFNGALSSTLAIHPLIVTLGVGTAIQGAVLLWTAGFPGRLGAGDGDEIRLHRRACRSIAGSVARSVVSRRDGDHERSFWRGRRSDGGSMRSAAIPRRRPTR